MFQYVKQRNGLQVSPWLPWLCTLQHPQDSGGLAMLFHRGCSVTRRAAKILLQQLAGRFLWPDRCGHACTAASLDLWLPVSAVSHGLLSAERFSCIIM